MKRSLAAGLTGGLVWFLAVGLRERADDPGAFLPVRGFVEVNVPAATRHLDGRGFVRAANGELVGDGAPAQLGAERRLTSTAPKRADEPLEVRAGSVKASVSFVGAAAKPAHLEGGLAVYRDAYPSTDVVAVHDPERVEILYVVKEPAPAADLRLQLALSAGAHVRIEPTTAAAIVDDEHGRARLRIAPPRAIDSAGEVRDGSYRIVGDELRLALSLEGMKAPIVVDPAMTIPLWTVLADGRAPGGTVYDSLVHSRESHAVFDGNHGTALVVRPARSQQFEDSIFLFGDAMRAIHEGGVQRISGHLRDTAGATEVAEFKRGFSLASESWSWDHNAWSIAPSFDLPGSIDPSLAFDSNRSRVVLYGGAPPSLSCHFAFSAYQAWLPFHCGEQDSLDVTWEWDGAAWSARKVAGSPPPRLRAAMAFDATRGTVVLHGGRAIDSAPSDKLLQPYGAVFPENLRKDLLADTWTYDGSSWSNVPTGHPPPAREGAQLVYDADRKVSVLVGGHLAAEDATSADRFSIYEFDAVDWNERVAPADPALPPTLRTRRGTMAFWNATRRRVTLVGGAFDRGDACTLTQAEIAARKSDPAQVDSLAAQGCLGGYTLDAWEWDGSTLSKVADARFAGWSGTTPVFAQVQGAVAWSVLGPGPHIDLAAPSDGTSAVLVSQRFDRRARHFALKSTLEKAFETSAAPRPLAYATATTTSAVTATISPLFASKTRPEVVFDPARALATVFGEDGSVLETDGATWTDKTPQSSPFERGAVDFFAATWDTTSSRVVLFDPTTGRTWANDGARWTDLAATGPTRWALDPAIRRERDLEPKRDDAYADTPRDINTAFEAAARAMPRMTFDRARGVTVMIYGDSLYQLSGSTWTASALPAGLRGCSVATHMVYDGARSKTVVFGCSVPAITWEWDGTTWQSFAATPWQALVTRGKGDGSFAPNPYDYLITWQANLQLDWSHPNAAFESPGLGGIGTVDADGTLRIWNGTAWSAGPTMPQGFYCQVSRVDGSSFVPSAGLRNVFNQFPFPYDIDQLSGRDFLPTCMFPPVFEDFAHGRVVSLRDGPRGALSAAIAGSKAGAWSPLPFGLEEDGVVLNPYPAELMSPEHVYLYTRSDPATRVYDPRNTSKLGDEKRVHNLFWPFRVLADPVAKRVRVLTNRGLLWELGGETLKGLGDDCTAQSQCAEGTCTSEGVCCNVANCGDAICTTCKGAHPGTCEAVASGAAETRGRCGSGECAGSCSGVSGSCKYDAYRACGPQPSCQNGVVTPVGHCAPNGAVCVLAGSGPTCPAGTGGKPDLTALTDTPSGSAPCSLAPTACPNDLACAPDGVSCKITCLTRADCITLADACDPVTHTCAPDSVTQTTKDQGIPLPARRPPPIMPTKTVVDTLADAGSVVDDAGVLHFPAFAFGNVSFTLDPSAHPPIKGMQRCVDFIVQSIALNPTYSIDSSVASARRCETATPYDEKDPGGPDCCPETCLAGYFESRKTLTPGESLQSMIVSGCYPGTYPIGSDAGVEGGH